MVLAKHERQEIYRKNINFFLQKSNRNIIRSQISLAHISQLMASLVSVAFRIV